MVFTEETGLRAIRFLKALYLPRAAHSMIDSELADKLNTADNAYVTNMKLTDYEDENALNELYAKLVKDKIDEADAGKQTA